MNDCIPVSTFHAMDDKQSMSLQNEKPSRSEAEEAVRTLIKWAGDDPDREGLLDTPNRVIRSYEEFFAGYAADPAEILSRSFEETDGYDEMVLLKNISFESHCEHHIVPILGTVHVAYVPETRVVGISKLARIVEAYGKRLQIQERLTSQIANVIFNVLRPEGRGCYRRSAASMYDNARCSESRCHDGDKLHVGLFPKRRGSKVRVPWSNW